MVHYTSKPDSGRIRSSQVSQPVNSIHFPNSTGSPTKLIPVATYPRTDLPRWRKAQQTVRPIIPMLEGTQARLVSAGRLPEQWRWAKRRVWTAREDDRGKVTRLKILRTVDRSTFEETRAALNSIPRNM